MFVDEAEIILTAGHGGAGRVSFLPGAKAGPDGGSGGRGGDIYLKTTSDLTALRPFAVRRTIKGEDGEMGGKNQKNGHDGDNLEVILPMGSVLTEIDTGEVVELTRDLETVLICKGGIGGRGNYELRSSRNTTPERAQAGRPGVEKHFKIHLKLIADFGLIGLPNAGKSSLLNELTKANVKTAEYPFTTLEPNLGAIYFDKEPRTNNPSRVMADIPGLIEGASQGRGLGIKFLKHIEKVTTILHCVAADSPDVLSDYQTVWKELDSYAEVFKTRQEIILLTKSDLVSPKELTKRIKELKKLKKQIVPVSIHDWDSLESLKSLLRNC